MVASTSSASLRHLQESQASGFLATMRSSHVTPDRTVLCRSALYGEESFIASARVAAEGGSLQRNAFGT